MITPANEYEVLQLLMADMRDRLTAYPGTPTIVQSPCCCVAVCVMQALACSIDPIALLYVRLS